MKRLSVLSLAAMALGLLAERAVAQSVIDGFNKKTVIMAPDTGSSVISGDCCPKRNGLFLETEALFLRYHRDDGLRVGDDEVIDDATDSYELSPRVTVGYMTNSGLGARVRWWEYSHSLNTPDVDGDRLRVDTYNIDAEIFKRIPVGCHWLFEFSGGLRYNSFNEDMFDIADGFRTHQFNGFGGICAVEVERSLGKWGSLFGRARLGVLHDDVVRVNDGSGSELLNDSTVGMIELAAGYQIQKRLRKGAIVFARVGAEWQKWYNYSSEFAPVADEEDFWGDRSDVSFGGFMVTVGLRR